jgi:hypothetical protein
MGRTALELDVALKIVREKHTALTVARNDVIVHQRAAHGARHTLTGKTVRVVAEGCDDCRRLQERDLLAAAEYQTALDDWMGR